MSQDEVRRRRAVQSEARGEGGPVALGDGVRRLIAALGLETRFLEERALSVLAEAVGQVAGGDAASIARPESIRRGEMVVSVGNDAWRHRLFFDRDRIREHINRTLGQEVVRTIRFAR